MHVQCRGTHFQMLCYLDIYNIYQPLEGGIGKDGGGLWAIEIVLFVLK